MSSPQQPANITEPASAQSPPTTVNEAKPNNISTINSQVASTIMTSPSQYAEPSGQVWDHVLVVYDNLFLPFTFYFRNKAFL